MSLLPFAPADIWREILRCVGPVDCLCVANTCRALRVFVEKEERAGLARRIARHDMGFTIVDAYMLKHCVVPLGALYFYYGPLRHLWAHDFYANMNLGRLAYFDKLDLSMLWLDGFRWTWMQGLDKRPTEELVAILHELVRRGMRSAGDIKNLLIFNRAAVLDAFLAIDIEKAPIMDWCRVCILHNALEALKWVVALDPTFSVVMWSTANRFNAMCASDEMAEYVLGPPDGNLVVTPDITWLLSPIADVPADIMDMRGRPEIIERVKRYVGVERAAAITASQAPVSNGSDKYGITDDVVVKKASPEQFYLREPPKTAWYNV